MDLDPRSYGIIDPSLRFVERPTRIMDPAFGFVERSTGITDPKLPNLLSSKNKIAGSRS